MDAVESSPPVNTPCPNCGALVPHDHLIPVGDTQVCTNCRESYLGQLKEGAPTQHGIGLEEEIRQDHIKHEASLKSIGFLYLLGGVLATVGGVAGVIGMAANGDDSFMLIFMALYAVLGVLIILLARGIRKLKRWTRIPATILACLGLLNIPIGTLINGYILWLIWSRKGKMVFSEEYQDVIEKTPHIKYKTPLVVWILVGLVLFGLLAAMAIPAFQAVRNQ
ncbi:MAG: hypothetical protein ACQKBV_05605 [Puniceicoccales bacterium]